MQPRGATTLGEQAPAPRLRPLRGHSLGHHASAWLWAGETVDLQSINVECMVRIRGLTNVHSTSSSSREVEQQSCTTSSPSRCSGRNACAWASSSRTRPCPSSTYDNCMSMCEARVAIASWPSTRKAKSAPVPLLCSLSTRSANVGHVTTAPCLWTPILRSCLSHNRLHSLSPTFIWNGCQDKYGYEGNVVG